MRPALTRPTPQATSPLTHNISGTAKAALQSVLAFWIWGNPATFKGIIGIIFVLGGSLLYTVVKMRENAGAAAAAASASQPPKDDSSLPLVDKRGAGGA